MQTERRVGQRFEISLPVRLEWVDEENGGRIVEEGRTENVSTNGTLVHLSRNLPRVGSEVKIAVFEDKGLEVISVAARVLRIERNPAHPLAALTMGDAAEEWRENVFQNEDLIEAFSDKPENYED